MLRRWIDIVAWMIALKVMAMATRAKRKAFCRSEAALNGTTDWMSDLEWAILLRSDGTNTK